VSCGASPEPGRAGSQVGRTRAGCLRGVDWTPSPGFPAEERPPGLGLREARGGSAPSGRGHRKGLTVGEGARRATGGWAPVPPPLSKLCHGFHPCGRISWSQLYCLRLVSEMRSSWALPWVGSLKSRSKVLEASPFQKRPGLENCVNLKGKWYTSRYFLKASLKIECRNLGIKCHMKKEPNSFFPVLIIEHHSGYRIR
jgi:hypothetical protein